DLALALAGAEAHAAGMPHERVQGMQVAPARLGGALAEIVLLAVALAELLDVEQAHLAQAVAADVHAEAHAGRHVDRLAGVRARERGVETGSVPAFRQLVGLAEARIAANG